MLRTLAGHVRRAVLPVRPAAAVPCTGQRRSIAEDAVSRTRLVTTPIYYVNASPHLGHVYTSVLADAVARWLRVAEPTSRVLLSSGTDEHGLKIQRAAAAAGVPPQSFADRVSQRFRDLLPAAGVAADDFVRTSETRHIAAAQAMWKRLADRDLIYRGEYQGWYSVSDEEFVPASAVRKDDNGTMVSVASGSSVEWMAEHNYVFRLSRFRQPLIDWLRACPDAVQPVERRHEVLAWLNDPDGMQDLSVSRQRLQWGVPVPDDDAHTMYVWLDALTNYLTVAGFPSASMPAWPAAYHIIGKDILRFHAVYWPAFLLGAGLPLPRRVIAHAHWTMSDGKMSKSRGNVVVPDDLFQRYGNEAVRYFLLRDGGIVDDARFSEPALVQRVNADLANVFGNLVSRCAGLYPHIPRVPHFAPRNDAFLAQVQQLTPRVDAMFRAARFDRGITEMMTVLHSANQYLSDTAPWALRRTDPDAAGVVVHDVLDALRVVAILLQPVTPQLASAALDRLAVPPDQRYLVHAYPLLRGGTALPKGRGSLFPRINQDPA